MVEKHRRQQSTGLCLPLSTAGKRYEGRGRLHFHCVIIALLHALSIHTRERFMLVWEHVST